MYDHTVTCSGKQTITKFSKFRGLRIYAFFSNIKKGVKTRRTNLSLLPFSKKRKLWHAPNCFLGKYQKYHLVLYKIYAIISIHFISFFFFIYFFFFLFFFFFFFF